MRRIGHPLIDISKVLVEGRLFPRGIGAWLSNVLNRFILLFDVNGGRSTELGLNSHTRAIVYVDCDNLRHSPHLRDFPDRTRAVRARRNGAGKRPESLFPRPVEQPSRSSRG
jgi:hypothetical protein